MGKKLDEIRLGSVSLKSFVTFIAAVAIFAVISWIFFYPNDVQGDVLQQSDVVQGIANGHEGVEYEAKSGEITRWTDALFGGMPTFQIRPTYSSTPYLSWFGNVYCLNFPAPVGWVFIMMLGFFLLMLAFDVKWYLAVLGAIGYGFSTYFLILIGAGHIWKLLTLAYVPPTIAGIVWCYRGKYLGGAALAALFAALQLMSNHVQMTYYFAFVIIALVIGYLVAAIKDHKVKQWCIATGALAVAAVLALAANAPNLYMTYKYSQETIRGGHSELTSKDSQTATNTNTNGGLDKEYITQWSYGKGESFTLLIPNVNGGATIKPEHGDIKMLSLAETSKAQKMADDGELGEEGQYLQQFPQYFGDQPMTNGPVYVGALICALFLLGCVVVKGPVKWALVVVTLLSLFLSWGHNLMWLSDLFIDYFPMYNKFRTVSSILVIAEFTMPLLAVLALQQMLTEEDFLKKNKGALYGSFGFCILVCLLGMFCPSMFGAYSAQETEQLINSGQLQQFPALDAAIRAIRGSLVSADAIRSLLFLLLGFGAIMLFVKGKMKTGATAAVLTALVLIDLYTVNKRYIDENTFVPAEEATTGTIAMRPADAQILKDKDPNYRVLDVQHFAEAMPSYFHKTVGGYHAAKLTRYNDLIERQIANNNMAVLNMLNTKYFIVDDNQVQQNPDALGNAWFVDTLTYVKSADEEMAFLDKFNPATSAVADKQFEKTLGQAVAKTAGDTISLTTYAPNHLVYKSHSAKGGVAVFSEIYFPWGWNVTVDGKPVEMGRVNYVLRALRLSAGDHTIDFKFDPQEVHTTEAVATTAIIIIFVALLIAVNVALFMRRRRKDEEPKQA